jgi:hypothetical protein
MPTRRAGLVTCCLLAALPAVAAFAEDRARLEPRRVATPPTIDGRLDDEAWQGTTLPLTEWLTYNPLNGEKMVQQTEVRAAYDDRYLYFAFHCVDPEPGKVRSTISRRDNMFNDDWVGLSLDSVGNGQSSYDLFINPSGVQGDVLTTPSSGENSAPDFVWDSAGQRTPEGYDVEIRVPLTTIRFKSGPDVRMGVLFWRRVSRLGMSASWPIVPAGKSFIEQHAALILHDLKRPLTLELTPSATYSRRETRATPTAFAPADSEPDAGLTVKYGLTSQATLEGTVNPDFSQVESDAFQVQVNQRYPLFFSEKRPFFMEGMGASSWPAPAATPHAHGRARGGSSIPSGAPRPRARRARWASASWPRATRPPAASSSASPIRSSVSAAISTSHAASSAWAGRTTWEGSSPTRSSEAGTTGSAARTSRSARAITARTRRSWPRRRKSPTACRPSTASAARPRIRSRASPSSSSPRWSTTTAASRWTRRS